MQVHTGYFSNPETHHKGWFKFYRARRAVEIWLGPRYVSIWW